MATPSSAPLDIYYLTFNTARTPIDPSILASDFFSALPSTTLLPAIIAISIQEIAPLAPAFLGRALLTPYFDAFTQCVALATEGRLRAHQTPVEADEYSLLLARHVGMTGLMVFIRAGVDVAWVQTAGAGCGVWQTGNKGAVGARLGVKMDRGIEEVTLVAAHLAPHEFAIERRREDWERIVRNLGFVYDTTLGGAGNADPASNENEDDDDTTALLNTMKPMSRSSKPKGLYDTAGPIFFGGDLNYRTSSSRPMPGDIENFPQPTNDTNSPHHLSKLLARDQLMQQRSDGVVLQSFAEQAITFAPTYKYAHSAVGPITTASTDDPDGHWFWATHRFPSWCDRILYTQARSVQVHTYNALPIQATSDHRPVALAVSVSAGGKDVLEAPYPLNPRFAEERAWAARRELVVGVVMFLATTREGQTILVGSVVGGLASWFFLRALV
ncbi:putative inositol 5-phosphatase [Microthyrium microscopicum]|uniref:Putative inositol 5-phosphatase n=1 Tax=Microthyrium microscopicum TaxID=703497 RepID=A0A6A6UQ39_9PEZI|nr:putative inositol 5-phosphatase [Microthyrium microscopicum]